MIANEVIMKKNTLFNLFISLSFFTNSYSMESNKRNRSALELDKEKIKEEYHEDENAIKRVKLDDEETAEFYKTHSDVKLEEINENQAIDQQTGLPLVLLDENEARNDILNYAKKYNYPSSSVEKDLIEPEMRRIDNNNLIVRLYFLPPELIELIFLFCMKSIFDDTISDLKTDQMPQDSEIVRSRFMVGIFVCLEPFKNWKKSLPYPKFLSLIRSLPLKKRRELIENEFIKRELGNYMRSRLVKLFRSDDHMAGKYLIDVTFSGELWKCEDRQYITDVLMFAYCLAEAGIHPNQNCYLIEDGNRKEAQRTDLTKPFCLLEFAMYNGNFDFMNFLLDEKSVDFSKISKNLNCLTAACFTDAIEIVRAIIKKGINWHREAIIEGSITAIKNNSRKVLAKFIRKLTVMNDIALLKDLIDKGLDVNQINLHVYEIIDEEPFFLTDEETPLMFAVMDANFEVTKKLIEEWGADVNAKNNENKTALYFCARCADEDDGLKMAEYLVEKGADVEINELDGTLMHIAALKDLVKLLEFFKRHGLDVNSVNNEGETPLMLAAQNKAVHAVCFLIESGAKINAKNNRGWTAIFYPFYNAGSSFCCLKEQQIVKCLVHKGANVYELFTDPSLGLNNSNLLHFAIIKKNLDAVKFLVEEFGFDVDQLDGNGDTPLMLAKKFEAYDIEDYLEAKMSS